MNRRKLGWAFNSALLWVTLFILLSQVIRFYQDNDVLHCRRRLDMKATLLCDTTVWFLTHVKFSAVFHADVMHVFLFLVICSAFVKWLNYIHYSLRNVLPDCKPSGPRRCKLCGNKWLMIIKYIFIPYVPLKQNNTPVGRVSKVATTCDLTLGFLLPFKIYFISF